VKGWDSSAAGWRWELESAWGVTKSLLIAAAVVVAMFAMAGYSPQREIPPLPQGFVCAPGDMDIRCPAGAAWYRSGVPAAEWQAPARVDPAR
jgi:hypothetical protein